MHRLRRGRFPDTQLHAAVGWQDDRVHLVRLQLLSYRRPGGVYALIQQRLFNLRLAHSFSQPPSASENFAAKKILKSSAENQPPPLGLSQLLRSRFDSLKKPTHLRQGCRDQPRLRMHAMLVISTVV